MKVASSKRTEGSTALKLTSAEMASEGAVTVIVHLVSPTLVPANVPVASDAAIEDRKSVV